MQIKTIRDYKRAVRAGPFAFPGGYPLVYLCSDGGVLCHSCCIGEAAEIMRAIRDGDSSGWRVVACDALYEGDSTCDHCGHRTVGAYEDEDSDPLSDPWLTSHYPGRRDPETGATVGPIVVYRSPGGRRARVDYANGGETYHARDAEAVDRLLRQRPYATPDRCIAAVLAERSERYRQLRNGGDK